MVGSIAEQEYCTNAWEGKYPGDGLFYQHKLEMDVVMVQVIQDKVVVPTKTCCRCLMLVMLLDFSQVVGWTCAANSDSD